MMVVAPRTEHAVATALEKPRVISELKKNKKKAVDRSQHDCKPRISGSLEWGVDGSAPWQARHVEVRDGSLVVLTSPSGSPELRIPLRHLNLQPGSRPRAFSLSRDQAPPVATFQAGSEQEYERWVKTLAIELMRQTPLEAVRFLDILGITSKTPPPSQPDNRRPLRRGASEDNLAALGVSSREGRLRNRRTRMFETNNNNNYVTPKTVIESRRDNLENDRFRIGAMKRGSNFIENDLGKYNDRVLEKRQNTSMNNKSLPMFSDSDSSEDCEKDFADLISKCQQVENYVPVREKRRLFESLCQGRRFAQSTENLYQVVSSPPIGQLRNSNRAQSLHDLSRLKCNVAVSEICRYFEERGKGADIVDGEGRGRGECCNAYLSRRRLQRSERRLAKIKQETVDVEEELWRIQEEMAVLDRDAINDRSTRSLTLKRYNALECHLAHEEARLTRLQSDAAKALKEVELAANNFETSLAQSDYIGSY